MPSSPYDRRSMSPPPATDPSDLPPSSPNTKPERSASREREYRRSRSRDRSSRERSSRSDGRGSRRRRSSRSRSRTRSRSRSYERRGRDYRRGSRTRSRSRSRSRDRRRDRDRDRHYRDRDDRYFRGDRHGPPGYGPPPDFRGRFDHGPPPPGFFNGPGGPYFDNFPPQPHRRPGGRATRRDDGPPGVSLLVRNVSPDVTPQDLQLAFGRIGEVRDVYIPRDFHSQQPKGFAFIEYATAEMAREAKDEMNKFLMKGMELEVVYAQEKRKTPNEMRGRVVDGSDGRRGRGDDFQRSSSFERHKRRERERENYFRPENDNRKGEN